MSGEFLDLAWTIPGSLIDPQYLLPGDVRAPGQDAGLGDGGLVRIAQNAAGVDAGLLEQRDDAVAVLVGPDDPEWNRLTASARTLRVALPAPPRYAPVLSCCRMTTGASRERRVERARM